MGTLLLAAVVAVLTPTDVVLCETSPPSVVRRVALSSPGLAIFAAPDGRLLVPLAGEDTTAVVAAGGPAGHLPGRLFPLFFDEVDRLHTVMPGAVVTLSYPERLLLFRSELPGGLAPWRAATSRDGRLVIVLASDRRSLAVVTAKGEVAPVLVGLPLAASAVAVAPDASWVLVGLEQGELLLVDAAGSVAAARLGIGAAPAAMAATADGRHALVATGWGRGGAVVSVRVKPGSRTPLKEVARAPLSGSGLAVAEAGGDVVAVTSSGLTVLAVQGLALRGRLAIEGAQDVAALPARVSSLVPPWGDRDAP